MEPKGISSISGLIIICFFASSNNFCMWKKKNTKKYWFANQPDVRALNRLYQNKGILTKEEKKMYKLYPLKELMKEAKKYEAGESKNFVNLKICLETVKNFGIEKSFRYLLKEANLQDYG